uniref:Putative portal protein n=1 Tax=viral metagenome TaxID=1070528 RepID=A0A6M3XHY1_9ZZZZ
MAMPEEMNRRYREKLYSEGEERLPDEVIDDTSEEEAASEKAKELKIIQDLAASLVVKRNTAVTARASCGIEQIWREDELAFEGMDESYLRTRMIDYATQTAPARQSNKGPKRSQVIINIVRPKCETAEGRFSDIQLPTDGKNWGLLVTPKPEIADGMKDERPAVMKQTREPVLGPDGQPVKIKQIAKSEKEVAEDKMSKMETVIDDQLTECSYNGESRKAIQNAVRLGTGIMKGPMVVKDVKKSWTKQSDDQTSVRVLKVTEDERPASRSVDPWDVFPDPECRDEIKRAAYIWERRTITPRELRDLAGIETYLSDQIEEVLREEPAKIIVATPKENEYLVRYSLGIKGSSYELWEYNGDVNKTDLEAMGCDCSQGLFPSISACVVMVNDRPIKATLNPLDTGDLPYDFFCWTKRAGVPWGIGVARELMWTQRVLIAAWRAMMDNAGDSAGANMVVGASVEPMDGKWEITGKKLWKSTDENLRIDRQFGLFQLTNNQVELQNVIELALRFADMESQLPMLFTGEKGELPETLGATNIMVDSSNVALRTRVKLWDDSITRPHITRYYDWNMQYNEDDSIKGDYKVDPRGTSFLLEREQQAEELKNVLSIRADPELSDMIDWEKTMRKLGQAKKIDLLTEDAIAEKIEERKKQPPPMDPQMETAKVRVEGELKKAEMVQNADMAALEFKAQQAELDRAHETQIKLMDRDIKAMELSQTSGIALDKIKAELTIVAQKLKTQIMMSRDKNLKPSPQLIEPIAEPAPKADVGYAYTQ